MDAKKLVLLVGALVVAAVTAIMAKHMSAATVAPQVMAAAAPVPTGPQVLVATKPLPMGTILGPDSFKFQPWPKELVDNAYYVQGKPNVEPAKMAGWVVRNPISAGQPLTQGSLVSPGDRGFLAAALTPGMRAVTVSVSGANAVAGFVFPGDRVDVVLSQDVPTADSGLPLKTAETIVSNVRVLATDQRTDNTPTPDGKSSVTTYSLVTLEATPKLAEKVAVAGKLGQLSLSLRPLADTTQQLEAALGKGDGKTPDDAARLSLAAMPQDGKGSFTVGGEVSRFARSSMPRVAAAAPGGSPAPAAGAPAPAYTGPVVRVARGTAVTLQPVVGGF